jgi:hypothetical protein
VVQPASINDTAPMAAWTAVREWFTSPDMVAIYTRIRPQTRRLGPPGQQFVAAL